MKLEQSLAAEPLPLRKAYGFPNGGPHSSEALPRSGIAARMSTTIPESPRLSATAAAKPHSGFSKVSKKECNVYSDEAVLQRSAEIDRIFADNHMAAGARFKLALDYKHATPPD